MPKHYDQTIEVARAGVTIKEFCQSHGISRALYYKTPLDQRPAELRLGRRVIITTEAAVNWRERMTKQSSAA